MGINTYRKFLLLTIFCCFIFDLNFDISLTHHSFNFVQLNEANAAGKRKRRRRKRKKRHKKTNSKANHCKKQPVNFAGAQPWSHYNQRLFTENQTPREFRGQLKLNRYIIKSDKLWAPIYASPSRGTALLAQIPSGHIPDYLGSDTGTSHAEGTHKPTRWHKVSFNGQVGWLPPNYAQLATPLEITHFNDRRKAYFQKRAGAYKKVAAIAHKHTECSNLRSEHRRYNTYRLKDRMGYYLGSTIAFARAACRKGRMIKGSMLNGNNKASEDVLAHYQVGKGKIDSLHDRNGKEENLIALFSILLPQGLRESNGEYREGRDIKAGAKSQKAETAEGGLVQTSFDVHGRMSYGATAAMRYLESKYKNNPEACMNDIFDMGLHKSRAYDECRGKGPKPVVGSGEGAELQKLLRNCPAAAIEHAAITTRHNKHHYGPLVRKETTPFKSCVPMLKEVFDTVKSNPSLCDSLAIEPEDSKSQDEVIYAAEQLTDF